MPATYLLPHLIRKYQIAGLARIEVLLAANVHTPLLFLHSRSE